MAIEVSLLLRRATTESPITRPNATAVERMGIAESPLNEGVAVGSGENSISVTPGITGRGIYQSTNNRFGIGPYPLPQQTALSATDVRFRRHQVLMDVPPRCRMIRFSMPDLPAIEGPCGINNQPMMVKQSTDNRNRCSPEFDAFSICHDTIYNGQHSSC